MNSVHLVLIGVAIVLVLKHIAEKHTSEKYSRITEVDRSVLLGKISNQTNEIVSPSPSRLGSGEIAGVGQPRFKTQLPQLDERLF